MDDTIKGEDQGSASMYIQYKCIVCIPIVCCFAYCKASNFEDKIIFLFHDWFTENFCYSKVNIDFQVDDKHTKIDSTNFSTPAMKIKFSHSKAHVFCARFVKEVEKTQNSLLPEFVLSGHLRS